MSNIFLNTAEAIVSTVNDLIIWNHALHHNIVLPKNVTELMLTEHVQMDSQNTSNYYCYGIMKTKYSNGDIFIHDGGIAGFITTVTYRPCDQLSFISCTNVNIYTSQIATAFKREHENFKHVEDQKEFDTAVDAVLETEFPGFLIARTKYDRLQLKDIVPLETK